MSRLGTTALIAFLSLAATAGGASSGDRLIQVGTRLYVGSPLACGVVKAKGAVTFACLERNPKNGQVYSDSLGVTLTAGKSSRVAIIYYDKHGNPSAIWHHDQPHGHATGLFPTGKPGKDILATPDDRFKIGGTNIFCPVLDFDEILCAVVNTKTLKPVPGTYAIDAAVKSVEVEQITKNGHFVPVKGYNEPKLKG